MTIQAIEATPDQARQLTDRIRIAVEGTWQLIVEAYQSRAWSALGYNSWDDYCTREFGTSRLKLPREDRAEQVASLRESGLSIRAIASATGASKNTVKSDLREVGQIDPPAPEQRTETFQSGAAWVEPGDETPLETETVYDKETYEVVNEYPLPKSENITGMDGKQYSRPEPMEPSKPRRRPITDQAGDAGWELRKATEKLQRIFQDDRLGRNKEEVSTHLRGHLEYAIETLQGFLDTINDK